MLNCSSLWHRKQNQLSCFFCCCCLGASFFLATRLLNNDLTTTWAVELRALRLPLLEVLIKGVGNNSLKLLLIGFPVGLLCAGIETSKRESFASGGVTCWRPEQEGGGVAC